MLELSACSRGFFFLQIESRATHISRGRAPESQHFFKGIQFKNDVVIYKTDQVDTIIDAGKASIALRGCRGFTLENLVLNGKISVLLYQLWLRYRT